MLNQRCVFIDQHAADQHSVQTGDRKRQMRCGHQDRDFALPPSLIGGARRLGLFHLSLESFGHLWRKRCQLLDRELLEA